MNRIVVQRCIFLGVFIVLLGGIVFLISAPAQETEQNVTQEIVEPTLPSRPPEGYQVPARPAVTFPYTHISADRLRLANIRRVSDDEVLVFAGPGSPSIVSPDGQWREEMGTADLSIIRTDGSGETRVLFRDEPDSDRGRMSGGLAWSWDSRRVFYKVSHVYSLTPDSPVLEREHWVESVDIATGEITRRADIGYYDNLHSFATARYPDDPVIYRNREDKIDSVGTRDGSARWTVDHNTSLALLSPNKQMILAWRKGPPYFHYLIYATDGSGLLHSFEFDRDGVHPADGLLWSPDSTKFVYHHVLDRANDHSGDVLASELYLIDVDGASRTQLTDTPDVPEGIIGWTSDGQLVFVDYSDYSWYIADLIAK